MKKATVPLKEMLAAIDCNDLNFYSNLDAEQQKVFSPWLAMRYASSANGRMAEHYLLMVNGFVNVDFSALYNHPELQWKILAVIGAGSKQFHPWIRPGKKKGKNKIQEEFSKLYPAMKHDELELLESIHTKDEIKDLFRDAGYTNKEIKDITK